MAGATKAELLDQSILRDRRSEGRMERIRTRLSSFEDTQAVDVKSVISEGRIGTAEARLAGVPTERKHGLCLQGFS